jgi:uncharacterized membrane protein YdjX (TVP38/TMEM64 family)
VALPAKELAIYFGLMLSTSLVAQPPLGATTLYFARTAAPAVIAAVATAAAALAALLDWHLVRRVFRVRTLDQIRAHRLFVRAERWAKVAPFWTTFGFAALPLPFTIARVLVPLSGYPLPRYVAAVTLGRFPRFFVIASFGMLFDIPSWALAAMIGGGVAIGVIGAVARHFGWIGGRRSSAGPPAPPP